MFDKQAINQSINQSVNQPTSHSVNQSLSQSINQSVNQSMYMTYVSLSTLHLPRPEHCEPAHDARGLTTSWMEKHVLKMHLAWWGMWSAKSGSASFPSFSACTLPITLAALIDTSTFTSTKTTRRSIGTKDALLLQNLPESRRSHVSLLSSYASFDKILLLLRTLLSHNVQRRFATGGERSEEHDLKVDWEL